MDGVAVAMTLGLVAALVLLLCLTSTGSRRDATPVELRGDWWPKFEAEFRAYAERRRREHRRRAPDDRPPPG